MIDRLMIDMIGRRMKGRISRAIKGKRDSLTKNKKETSKSISQSLIEEIVMIDGIKTVSLTVVNMIIMSMMVMSSISLKKLMNKIQYKSKSSSSTRMKGQKMLSQRQEYLPLKRNLSRSNKLTSTRKKMKKCFSWMKASKVATTTIRYPRRIVILAPKQRMFKIHATL